METYSDMQLDALRELANIGSGTAATALSSLLGRPIDVSVPNALALPLADAVDAAGPADAEVTAVVLPIFGDLDAVVLMLFHPQDAAQICGLLGVEADTEVGVSALGEVGNILGSSYVGALGMMTGLALEPRPPQTVASNRPPAPPLLTRRWPTRFARWQWTRLSRRQLPRNATSSSRKAAGTGLAEWRDFRL